MSPLNISLKGKTAIITGGTKNLGYKTVLELAKFGANIVIAYHSSSETTTAEEIISELKIDYGVEAIAIQGDLSKEEDAVKLFEDTKAKFGGVDIAINNAGMLIKKKLGDFTTEEYDVMFNVNSKASFQFMKCCYKYVNEGGSIVFLVSALLGAYVGDYSLYQGAKASVEFFVKAASKELLSKGINVCCVAPGPMDTPFLYVEGTNEQTIKYLKSQAIGNKLTEVDDIVPIVRFLVTEGKWITGQTIFASGGVLSR